MIYISVEDAAKKWNVSERSVRNYCAIGKIHGTILAGKTWKIPETAEKPKRKNAKIKNDLLSVLREEKKEAEEGRNLPQSSNRFDVQFQSYRGKSPDA